MLLFRLTEGCKVGSFKVSLDILLCCSTLYSVLSVQGNFFGWVVWCRRVLRVYNASPLLGSTGTGFSELLAIGCEEVSAILKHAHSTCGAAMYVLVYGGMTTGFGEFAPVSPNKQYRQFKIVTMVTITATS